MKRLLRLVSFICVLGLLSGCGTTFSGTPSPDPVIEGPTLEEVLSPAPSIEPLEPPESTPEPIPEPIPVLDQVAPPMLWGREQLDPELQALYDAISYALACRQDLVEVPGFTSDDLELAYHAVTMDHPEYFWFNAHITYTDYSSPNGTDVSCLFEYSLTAQEIPEMAAALESYVSAYLSSPAVAYAQNDYERILAVLRGIVTYTDYDIGYLDCQNLCSVVTDGRAVCAGYARMFQYIMHRLGIPCVFVAGVGTGDDHAWCIVQCGGQWYQIDPTYSDPTNDDGTPNYDASYFYCMVTDGEMYRDHVPDLTLPLPVCTDTTWNYFVQSGRQFDSWDPNAYAAALRVAAENGEDWFQVRFTNADSYYAAMDALFTQGEIWGILERCGLYDGYSAATYYYIYYDDYYSFSLETALEMG